MLVNVLFLDDYRRAPGVFNKEKPDAGGEVGMWRVTPEILAQSKTSVELTKVASKASHVIAHLQASDLGACKRGAWPHDVQAEQIVLCTGTIRMTEAATRHVRGRHRQVVFFAKRPELLNQSGFLSVFTELNIDIAWDSIGNVGQGLPQILRQVIFDPPRLALARLSLLCQYALAVGLVQGADLQSDGAKKAVELMGCAPGQPNHGALRSILVAGVGADIQKPLIARSTSGLPASGSLATLRADLKSELGRTALPAALELLVTALEGASDSPVSFALFADAFVDLQNRP